MIDVSPGRLLKLILGIDIGLILANFISYGCIYFSGGGAKFLADRFILSEESSLPTWYSSLQIFICASLLFSIGLGARQLRQKNFRRWWGLSLLFLYISMDEVATIRESIAGHSKRYLETSGVFHYSWVIVAIPAVILLALLYARFVIQLPNPVRNLFFVSGAMFIAGALGFEMISAFIRSASGVTSLMDAPTRLQVMYAIATTIEEALEITGVTVFLYALLVYIKQQNVILIKMNPQK